MRFRDGATIVNSISDSYISQAKSHSRFAKSVAAALSGIIATTLFSTYNIKASSADFQNAYKSSQSTGQNIPYDPSSLSAKWLEPTPAEIKKQAELEKQKKAFGSNAAPIVKKEEVADPKKDKDKKTPVNDPFAPKTETKKIKVTDPFAPKPKKDKNKTTESDKTKPVDPFAPKTETKKAPVKDQFDPFAPKSEKDKVSPKPTKVPDPVKKEPKVKEKTSNKDRAKEARKNIGEQYDKFDAMANNIQLSSNERNSAQNLKKGLIKNNITKEGLELKISLENLREFYSTEETKKDRDLDPVLASILINKVYKLHETDKKKAQETFAFIKEILPDQMPNSYNTFITAFSGQSGGAEIDSEGIISNQSEDTNDNTIQSNDTVNKATNDTYKEKKAEATPHSHADGEAHDHGKTEGKTETKEEGDLEKKAEASTKDKKTAPAVDAKKGKKYDLASVVEIEYKGKAKHSIWIGQIPEQNYQDNPERNLHVIEIDGQKYVNIHIFLRGITDQISAGEKVYVITDSNELKGKVNGKIKAFLLDEAKKYTGTKKYENGELTKEFIEYLYTSKGANYVPIGSDGKFIIFTEKAGVETGRSVFDIDDIYGDKTTANDSYKKKAAQKSDKNAGKDSEGGIEEKVKEAGKEDNKGQDAYTGPREKDDNYKKAKEKNYEETPKPEKEKPGDLEKKTDDAIENKKKKPIEKKDNNTYQDDDRVELAERTRIIDFYKMFNAMSPEASKLAKDKLRENLGDEYLGVDKVKIRWKKTYSS